MLDSTNRQTLRAPARSAWRVLGAAGSVVVLLLAGLVAWTWFAPRHEVAERHEHRAAVARVVITSTGGDVTVEAGPAGVVTVERRLSWSSLGRPAVDETLDGDTLTVTGRCPRVGVKLGLGSRCSVDLTVRVPGDVAVEARTEAGDVRADRLSGDVRMAASHGDVAAADVTGRLWMRADSGRITGTGLRAGDVDARIDSGDLDLAFADPPSSVTAASDAGDVTVRLPRGAYRLRVQADAGGRQVEVPDDPRAAATVTARADAGSVNIRYAG